MKRLLILGSTGMLGTAIVASLEQLPIELLKSSRNSQIQTNEVLFDAEATNISDFFRANGNFDYVINCIGTIKPYIDDSNQIQVENAIRVNAVFPHELAKQSEIHGFKIIQIATDCVFSGLKGEYSESDPHDPHDVYGKTKSLGEVNSSNFMNIRCSIIGPENGRSTSLWEWVANQPSGAEISGYLDHHWNGVTTKVFAEICRGIIENDNFVAGTHHLVPADSVNKHDLVSMIAECIGRGDIRVNPVNTDLPVNRTIGTEFPEVNAALWKSAGYSSPPSIREMVEGAALSSNL